MERRETTCPYVAGNQITVQIQTPSCDTFSNARIVRVFDFTLSCVMVVRIDCPALGLEGNEEMVLKVFDRRFAEQARDDEKVQPWSLNLEEEYIRFLHDNSGSEFVNALPSGTEDPPRAQADLWNPSQEEAFLHFILCGLYDTEMKAYDLLKDLQGKDIPHLVANVLIPAGNPAMPDPCSLTSNPHTNASYPHGQNFPGILLEYLPGFPLTELADNAPTQLWQSICDDAIRIINLISDHGILNEDVNTRSFIVNLDLENPTPIEHQPVMEVASGAEETLGVERIILGEVEQVSRVEESPEVEQTPGVEGPPEAEQVSKLRTIEEMEETAEKGGSPTTKDHVDTEKGMKVVLSVKMVPEKEKCPKFRVTMIDFALCSFRDEYKDDQEWSESKAMQEEEEAIGLIMQSKLGGEFIYQPSCRYTLPSSEYEGGEGFV